MNQINAADFLIRMQKPGGFNLLDVREEIEYHTYNIGGKNIPLSILQNEIDKLGYNKADEIIVICKAGIRSHAAQSCMLQNGYSNVINLTGGLLALQRLRNKISI